MSKQAKIIIFSVILFASFLMKHCSDDKSSYEKPNAKEEKSDWDPNDLEDNNNSTPPLTKVKDLPPVKSIDDLPKERTIKDKMKDLSKFKKYDYISSTPRPQNGFSPYNSIFGAGVYNNSAENTVQVTAPETADIVIFIKDVYSGVRIRNEYIRSNTTFSLTGIPYGNYKFSYLHGRTWDDGTHGSVFKGGLAKGNFMNDKGVGQSDDAIDFEFKTGYTGTYTLKLQLIENGNLKTVTASEDDI